MTPDHGSDLGRAGFDVLLRARRRAAGLTQEELATRAGVGVRTVRDLERGRASRPQRTTVELLAQALGFGAGERAAFHAAARGQPAVPPEPAPALPLPAPLVGRDADIADIAAILAEPGGPVSLVGLAGVGKSSLAFTVAHRVADAFPGGIGSILVTEGSSDSDLVSTIASVFEVPRAEDLAARLAGSPALLLLDAIERSPAAATGALRWLARTAPGLAVLATGRHPIEVPGERVWPVIPLDVPPADTAATLDEVARYPAAALFLARLRQVRREPLDDDEIGALVRLVRRLGGLPLALELAAARGRVLDLNEILHRYGDRVLDLAGAPASPDAVAVTLRDAVAASYRLLEPDERYALRRLSVFRNRWSVELAEALLTEDDSPRGGPLAGDPVPLLDRLLALGLVSVRGSGPTRFRLLDVVRDFAAEQAAMAGEVTAARRRHAVVFARFAARVAPDLSGSALLPAVARLDDVTGDLWAALAHAANDDPPTALYLASKLPRWWHFRGRDVAGRRWLRRLLDDPRTADVDPAVRAWAQIGMARLANDHGAGREELPAAETALAQFQRGGDVTGELAARGVLGALYMGMGDVAEARRQAETALALATAAGRARDAAVAQHHLTWHDMRQADLAAARRRLAAADRLAAESGDDLLRARVRARLAEVARLDGRPDEAEAAGRWAVAVFEELGDRADRLRALGTVGLVLAHAGRVAEAEAVLTELSEAGSRCGDGPPDRPVAGRSDGAIEGSCAMIEAHLALARGDRAGGLQLFEAAARAYAGAAEPRSAVAALVGAAAAADDRVERARLLDRLAAELSAGGIAPLPAEEALLHDLAGRQGD